MAGLKMIFGPEASVDTAGVKTFEAQPDREKAARDLGACLRDALKKKS